MGAFDTEYDKLNILNNISNLSMRVSIPVLRIDSRILTHEVKSVKFCREM